MKTCLWFLLMGWVAGIGVARGHDLLPLGELPALAQDWELHEADSLKQPGTPVRWIVFRNKVSGDLLSLATFPPEGQPQRDLIDQSDTAHECFRNGLPAWNRPKDVPHTASELTTLYSDVSHLAIFGAPGSKSIRVKVLKYGFISELHGRGNLMAQGYCWSGDKAVVFVQHTSASPITTDFAAETTRALVQKHGVIESSKTRE